MVGSNTCNIRLCIGRQVIDSNLHPVQTVTVSRSELETRRHYELERWMMNYEPFIGTFKQYGGGLIYTPVRATHTVDRQGSADNDERGFTSELIDSPTRLMQIRLGTLCVGVRRWRLWQNICIWWIQVVEGKNNILSHWSNQSYLSNHNQKTNLPFGRCETFVFVSEKLSFTRLNRLQ